MSTKLPDPTGKVALVTAAPHGIGMAIAAGCAEAGATVGVCVNDIFEVNGSSIPLRGYRAAGPAVKRAGNAAGGVLQARARRG